MIFVLISINIQIENTHIFPPKNLTEQKYCKMHMDTMISATAEIKKEVCQMTHPLVAQDLELEAIQHLHCFSSPEGTIIVRQPDKQPQQLRQISACEILF